MSEQVTANTIVCSEYQRLLEESLSARETLNENRAEVYRSLRSKRQPLTKSFDRK